jgi:hypothetical protein
VRNTVNDNKLSTDRRSNDSEVNTRDDEETLVADDRGALTPSQLVEQKLIGRLKDSPLLISQIQRRLKPGPR